MEDYYVGKYTLELKIELFNGRSSDSFHILKI